MRVLLIHPSLQSAEGHYGFLAAAEQLTDETRQVDVAAAPVWDELPGHYDIVHLSLRQLEYEPGLLQRVQGLRAAGVRVLVDVDVSLEGARLGELRRALCQAAGAVRVYRGAAAAEALLGPQVAVYEVTETPLAVQAVPSAGDKQGVLFWAAESETEMTRLLDWSALLAGAQDLRGHYRLHLAEWAEAGYQSEVLPHPELLRTLRAGGTNGMRAALRLLSKDQRSLAQILRSLPAGTPLPENPFVVNRREVGPPLSTEVAVTNGYRTLSPAYANLLHVNLRASSAVPAKEPYARVARCRRPSHWVELFAANRVYVRPSGFAGDASATQETLSKLALAAGCVPVGGPGYSLASALGGGRPGQALFKATRHLLLDPDYHAQELARLRALAAEDEARSDLRPVYITLLATA